MHAPLERDPADFHPVIGDADREMDALRRARGRPPMRDAEAVARPSERTHVPLTRDHLARLSAIAKADHDQFTRPDGRPEYRDRRLLAVLAQGAAQHWVKGGKGGKGVKDLDVWTFYAAIPGTPFPAAKRETHADFGPSELGTQAYDLSTARNANAAAKLGRWQTYTGRRVDLLMRALPVPAGAPTAVAVEGVQAWLEAGAGSRAARKPSSWWLAQKAMVVLDPPRWRGRVIWARE